MNMKQFFLPVMLCILVAPQFSVMAREKEDASARKVAHRIAHGIAMHGDLKYGPDFTHFEYANPDAPKGGTVRLAAIGTFDNLNPYILKGVSAAGMANTFETLMGSSDDEAFSQYGLIARGIETPADRSAVTFYLRKQARFHDGSTITADDVVFSFETLMEKGHPFFRSYYGGVEKVTAQASDKVTFTFKPGANRELPLIIGNGLPILSKAYWAGKDFEKTTLDAPMGSGPYKVAAVDPGRSITLQRLEDYWGAHLPVNAGRYNFGELRFDYYRDQTVSLEAFKSGAYDFRLENASKVWATGYDFPALKKGLVIKELIENEQPTGMQAFVFNIRKPIFRDKAVRQALGKAFDFEWTNRNLFYGAYTRTRSYFSNSELASAGLPAGEELKILEKYRDKIPSEVFSEEYIPPTSEREGGVRTNLRDARRILEKAGWVTKDNALVKATTNEPLSFEILLANPQFERVAAPFVKNLERLGVQARIRTVDSAQYEKRLEEFDFDMVVGVFGQSLSPGNEQLDMWGSYGADEPGSRNTIGIKDKVIDELVDLVISAPDRKGLVDRTRALDRVLLWGHYVVPHWHIRAFRVAYWNKFSRPQITPKYALGFDFWWVDPAKASALERDEVRDDLGEAAAGGEDEHDDEDDALSTLKLLLFIFAFAVFAFFFQRYRRKNSRNGGSRNNE